MDNSKDINLTTSEPVNSDFSDVAEEDSNPKYNLSGDSEGALIALILLLVLGLFKGFFDLFSKKK